LGVGGEKWRETGPNYCLLLETMTSSSVTTSSLYDIIGMLRRQNQMGSISPVEFVAGYILSHLIERDPTRWLLGRRRNPLPLPAPAPAPAPEAPGAPALGSVSPHSEGVAGPWAPLSSFPWMSVQLEAGGSVRQKLESSSTWSVVDLFNNWNFRKIPSYVNDALVNWALGRRKVHLLFSLPSPLEVLQMQARGHRCVTAFCEPLELSRILQDSCMFSPFSPLCGLLHLPSLPARSASSNRRSSL